MGKDTAPFSLPKVAIVGRPNVGKSAVFNRICKKRLAIVDDASGITRDRIYAEADFFGTPFQVIDTGGIQFRPPLPYSEEIRKQAEIAIEEADAIIQVVDCRAGATAADIEVAQVLHASKKPVCLAINKMDNPEDTHLIHQFHCLGIARQVAVSAAQNWQIAELLEAAFANLTPRCAATIENEAIRVAIIGRPNVGKSTLSNYFLQKERCIVSPMAGTTRDSIDFDLYHEDTRYTFIDTAGIRRKCREHETVDKFAAIRTEKAISMSDVCLLMLDAMEGVTMQERRIAREIERSGKCCILLFNKWDLVKGFRMEHCLKSVQEEIPFLKSCPKIMLSAKTGRNVPQIFSLIKEAHSSFERAIPTPELNRFIEETIQKNNPPMLRGKRLRIYYMTQVGSKPPTFAMFVNNSALMDDGYFKYLQNQFRARYNFCGVPLVFHLKGKKRQAGGPGLRNSFRPKTSHVEA